MGFGQIIIESRYSLVRLLLVEFRFGQDYFGGERVSQKYFESGKVL